MRFSDFLLVSDPADLDFIVGYSGEQNIRIDVSDFFADNISGSGNPGYIPVFTSNQTIGNSQIFQDGSNIVIGGVNAMGYRLAVGGSLYALGGTTIESVIPGSDTFRTIGEEGDSFIIPNDEDESIWTSRRIIHAPAVLTTESATLGQLNTAISSLEGDIELLLDLKVDKSSVGAPNGVASLDSGGKVPLSQIPDSIIGQVQYMGTWNAFTNTPTLNPIVPEEKGHYYVVSAAGVFGGVDYQIGDWIISNGLIWEKVDNTDAVTSVFGRIGAILALEADYQSFYPRLSQAYDNPTWINTLAFSKITGVPPFLLENQTITLSGDVTGSGKTSIASTISNNAVTDSKLRDSVGTSVIGRASSTTGDPGDIQATTDGHVLQRSGGTLLFGLISSDSIGSIDWSKIINTPTTLIGYGITNAYTKTEADNKFVPYTGANANVNLGSNNITANAFVKVGGTSAQFLKADGSVDVSQYVPTTRSVNAGTGLTGGGNLSSDVTLSFDTTWGDIRYAYRTRQLTINGTTYDLSADRTWNVGTVTSVGTSGPITGGTITGSGTIGITQAGSSSDGYLSSTDWNTFNNKQPAGDYVTIATDQTITGLKTIIRSGDVLNFKIGTDTLYGLKLFYSQNELAPSGEATWSFVNTFNRDGSGYEVTPLSFFRGVLVTGQRLLSSGINSNLLDYYANNPTGRYPVYAYNTGVQQFANAIVVGETNGIVNAVSGAISDLPSGVVANFKGRVIGSNAVNSNEFVTLGQIPTLTGYVPYTGATQSVNLGEYGLTTGFLGFDLTPTGTPTTVGTMYWDPAYRTASLITGTGATTLQVGQEEVVLVHNNTGSALTDGQVVYVTGSTGNLPSVSLADASLESTSAATLGVVTETIANGADGFVTLSGIVNGLNTLAYNEGDLLWLSETAGQFTNIKPVSPAHLVLIGYVIKRAGGNGSIFVKIQNTQELAESSDVLISSPEVDGQGLFLQTVSGVQLWRNRSIADVLGYTPANAATTLTINGTTFDLSSNRTWSVGTVTSVAALTLGTSGTDLSSTVANGTTTPVITLNVPTASATNRGALSAADWSTFNAKQNALTLTTTGTSGAATLVGATLNIPQYQSVLTNPITGTGTTNYLPKFTGSTTVGNSQIFDNGTNVGIGTSSPGARTVIATALASSASFNWLTFRNLSGGYGTWGFVKQGLNGLSLNYGTDSDTPNVGSAITFVYDGNVGIGTTNPTNRLHVASPDNEGIFMQGTSNGGHWFNFRSANSNLWSMGAQPGLMGWYNRTDATYKMVITDGGNVLIGTTTDAGFRLDVNGSGVFRNTLAIQSSGVNAAMLSWTSSNNGLLNLYNGGSLTTQILASGNSYFNGGNVGIGTSSPLTKLHADSTSLDGIYLSSFQTTSGGVDTGPVLYFGLNDGVNNRDAGQIKVLKENGTSGNYSTYMSFFTRPNGSSSTERMRISSSGNVLIGTTTDGGYKLDVNGTGRFTSNLYTSTALYINTTAAYGFRINSEGNNGFYNRGGSTAAHYPFLLENSSGALLFQVQGTGAATFSSSVTAAEGIINGTSTYVLSLNNTAQDTRLQLQVNGTQTFQLSSSSSQVNIFGTANIPMIFYTNSIERMRINSSGQLILNSTTAGGGTKTTFNVIENGGIQIDSSEGATQRYIEFTTGGTTKMLIAAGGNVLIGTTTDAGYKLDVNGSTQIRGGSSFAGLILNDSRAGGVDFAIYNGFPAAGDFTIRESGVGNYLVIKKTTGAATFSGSLTAASLISASATFSNFGSATAAVVAFADGNTGFFRPALNTLGITTAGAERMRITSSGDVQLNQTLSTIKTSANNSVLILLANPTLVDNEVRIELVGRTYSSDSNSIFYRANTHTFTGSNASLGARMTITSGGNVLIGTTTDAGYRLNVNGNAYANTLTLGAAGLNVSDYNFYSQTLSGAMGILGHNLRASASVANQVNVVNSGWYSSMIKMYYSEGITFHTSTTMYSAGDVYPMAGTERMRITFNGRIGMGSNDPIDQLHVAGGITSTGLANPTTTSVGSLQIGYDGTTGVIRTWNSSPLLFSNYNHQTFETSGSIRMRITSGGNVLIGTTTDVGARLYVDGAFRTGTLTAGTQTAAVDWRLGNARGGAATNNALIRVQINGVLVDLLGNYV